MERSSIVVDSPPVAAVSDSFILSGLVDKSVYVIRWEQTPRNVAKFTSNTVVDGIEINGAGKPLFYYFTSGANQNVLRVPAKNVVHYTRSDDFRNIDWRLFARIERLFVKLYEETQEFHVHILVDRSASMADPFPRKRRATLRLAVALAYLGLMNQHQVSLLSFGDSLRTELPPLRGQGHIHRILEHLSLPTTPPPVAPARGPPQIEIPAWLDDTYADPPASDWPA